MAFEPSVRAGIEDPAIEPETTGRFLVMMEPGEVARGASEVFTGAGLRLGSTGDLGGPPTNFNLAASEGILFPDLGIALVNADPDQVDAMLDVVTKSVVLRVVEPERVVRAIGEVRVDASYLLGYRDAVDDFVVRLLGTEAREMSGPAGPVEDGLSWGLRAIGTREGTSTGRGVRLAVLDTGVDLRHPDFLGRSMQTACFVEGRTVHDAHGHGTHCVGIAGGPARPTHLPRYGVACEADLFVGKVLDDTGRGVDGGILAGLQWAISQGCHVISMSLGARTRSGQAHSALYEQAARRALDRGSLIVAAAGNDSRRPGLVSPVSHPANCPSIVAVSAIDRAHRVAPFSNGDSLGLGVDIAGPGVDCRSSWPLPDLYKVESGTSMATPHVAGVAALVAAADPAARGHALRASLLQAARRLAAPAADVGAGLAQAPR